MENLSKEQVFRDYHDRIQNYLYGKVSDKYLAEDLASAVFIKIYDKLDSFDENKASLSTWIYTIANNTLIDYFRGRKVHEDVDDEAISGQISSTEEIDEELLNEEMLEELANALEKLAEREREIIILKYYSNLTLKDIAVKMNMSYANVKIVHGKALMKLKGILAEVM